MSARAITMVVACADNGVIGRDGTMPWHLPADLRHFKSVTMGTAMIMGRRTFDSLPGLLAHDVESALALAGDMPVSVIGGAEIFALFLDRADAVELTEVHGDFAGDTFLPRFDPARWREVSLEDHEAEGALPAYTFIRIERRA